MKIAIGSLEDLIGYGTAQGDEDVVWEGDIPGLKICASYWEKKGYRGVALLTIMLERRRTPYEWAELIPED